MYGFPLKFSRIYKQMCKGKRKFSTDQEAKSFPAHKRVVYLCPFCCMYHMSTHEPTPRHEQEKWWIIWKLEMGEQPCTMNQL